MNTNMAKSLTKQQQITWPDPILRRDVIAFSISAPLRNRSGRVPACTRTKANRYYRALIDYTPVTKCTQPFYVLKHMKFQNLD